MKSAGSCNHHFISLLVMFQAVPLILGGAHVWRRAGALNAQMDGGVNG